jgi:hypothetical protein
MNHVAFHRWTSQQIEILRIKKHPGGMRLTIEARKEEIFIDGVKTVDFNPFMEVMCSMKASG